MFLPSSRKAAARGAVIRSAFIKGSVMNDGKTTTSAQGNDLMRSPEGNDFANRGVYLEVVKNERLVFTDAYTRAWEPSAKPFMTVVLTFEDQGGKTKYTARVRHWSAADREAHEKMGFHTGWAQCAEQLAALVEENSA